MHLAVFTSRGVEMCTLVPGQTAGGFTEREEYLIAIPPGFSGTLLIDEIPLGINAQRTHWEWQPSFFAGTVPVESKNTLGGTVAEYSIDVSPDPGKLGRDFFEQMVESLRAANPTLIFGTEPSAVLIGTRGAEITLNAEYLRLKRYSGPYLNALRMISERPIYRSRSTRRLGALSDARRIDGQSIRSAMRNATAALAMANADVDPQAVRLDLPHIESSLDNGANRATRYFLDAVLTRLKQVSAALLHDAQQDTDSETRTEMRLRWPERRRVLGNIAHALEKRARTDPFSSVTRRELNAEGLNAIHGHPTYARAHRLAWSILRLGADGDTNERHPMTTTWEIFERWCFLSLAEHISVALGCAFEPRRISFLDRCLARYVIRAENEVVDVRLQERFGAYSGNAERLSLSRERVPDITVRFYVDQELRSWVALDAKYSIRRGSVLEAMSSAHIYHDSLRLQERRPDYALLVLPARPEPDWLCDNGFIENHRVGAVTLAHASSEARILVERLRAAGAANGKGLARGQLQAPE
jgi:hypothetical protein